MGIEYLGNKRNLENFIMENLVKHTSDSCHSCFDAFCGTGSVSAALKKKGYSVTANDFLVVSANMTAAILLNDEAPSFSGLVENGIISETDDPYSAVLCYLNSLNGVEGFITMNYSPLSIKNCDTERMYFSVENAKKIDAIREKIEGWTCFLAESESALLLADLVDATAAVSNIAGTYGCYMKYWKKKALKPIEMVKRDFVAGKPGARYAIMNDNVKDIIAEYDFDIIYADPPYTKRQYSAYYHILETIVMNDHPKLVGSTGMRNWKEKTSAFCYKRKAPGALRYMVEHARCKYFLLSYNDEGQIKHEEIMTVLSAKGEVVVEEMKYKRYKSNNSDNQRKDVIERLYILRLGNSDA